MNLSTRQLRAFLALAQLRNFTRAAQQVHLSQPAFSSLIRSLEDSLAAKLFDRDTRKVELTAAGRRFEKAAREVIEHFDEVMGAACRDLSLVDQLAVAGMPSVCARLLPVLLAEYRSAHAAIDTEIIDALPQQCADIVRSGKADLAIASLLAPEPDVVAEPLFTDRFHAVCRADHPLASKPEVQLADLAELPFIHFTRSTRLRQQIDDAVKPLKLKVVMEVERLEAAKGLVETGVGVSLVPGLTLFHFTGAQIAIRRLAAPGLTREVFLLKSAARPLSAAASLFGDHLRSRLHDVLRDDGPEVDPEKLAVLLPRQPLTG
jgi:DNA-binding transcriptional LysR family regulator